MTIKIIASVGLVFAILVTSVPAMAQNQKALPPLPRTPDGHPDLSGVWQPGSDKPGTWAEANQGVGVAEPGQGGGVRKGANPPYQPWAAKLVLEAYNRRNADDYTARCIPELELGGLSLYPHQFVQTPNLIVLLMEVRHAFRLIPLNEKHPEDLDPACRSTSARTTRILPVSRSLKRKASSREKNEHVSGYRVRRYL